jgi:hypothetical protein
MPPLPLVLLDVDGVLNAVQAWGRSDAWDDWRTGRATADGRSFPITWSPTVVEAVRSWQALAEVQWLTTWGHDANTSLRHLLGLPELPVAGTHDDVDGPAGAPDAGGAAHASVAPAAPDRLTGRWWKLDVVRRIVRHRRAAADRLARRRPRGPGGRPGVDAGAHDVAARRTRPAVGPDGQSAQRGRGVPARLRPDTGRARLQ